MIGMELSARDLTILRSGKRILQQRVALGFALDEPKAVAKRACRFRRGVEGSDDDVTRRGPTADAARVLPTVLARTSQYLVAEDQGEKAH